MRASLAVGAAFAASISGVSAQACAAGTAKQINGNWYCSPVDSISYTNFGSSGTYDEVVSMEGGKCQTEPKAYSGPLAPLNGEVSWHFRGPLHLKQFAYYVPGTGLPDSKGDAKPSPHERRSGHSHGHLHEKKEVRDAMRKAAAEQKRSVGDMVTTLIDGEEVSWENTWDGREEVPAPEANVVQQKQPQYSTDGGAPPVNAGLGNWGRQAFYNAEEGIADGVAFLNHRGGGPSGVFDETFGISLSYASSADSSEPCASPQILEDVEIQDGKEIVLMSDKECDGDCGGVRPGTVAHHGFGGENKLFLLEFSMPMSGGTGTDQDMPAAWILNANIPRTAQYDECSCWKSGCGEWDIFEVLDPGNTRCKSTLHGNVAGGDSNYFKRPTDGTVKVAVLFDGLSSTGHIKVIEDDAKFGESLSGADVTAYTLQAAASSIFALDS